MFAAYLLSAVAGYFSVFAWTRRADLALVAGALFAFAPWRLLEGNVQVQLTPYRPLIALFSHRVLSRGGRLAAAALVAWVVRQSLCAEYLAAQAFRVFGAVFVVVPGLAALTQ